MGFIVDSSLIAFLSRETGRIQHQLSLSSNCSEENIELFLCSSLSREGKKERKSEDVSCTPLSTLRVERCLATENMTGLCFMFYLPHLNVLSRSTVVIS